MCRYGAVYIPKTGKNELVVPSAPEGLVVSFDGPFQTNFSTLHKDDEGKVASLHDGHCLCDYEDWRTLFDYLESIRTINNIDKIEFLLFWSDDVYPLTNRAVVDLGLDTINERPVEGVIYEITISIPRRLENNIRKQTHLVFKSGKELRGTLSSYDKESGNGTFQSISGGETVYFHHKEISQVENLD
ncbi:MAG: hypothetical protein ACW98Y_05820 [Candidatus Thorarchaeota archaeon]